MKNSQISSVAAVATLFASVATAFPAANYTDGQLVERQSAPFTEIVGDGDPHQNYYNIQVSPVLTCDQSHQCTIGHEESKSYTIGWSASADAAGWISGGFEVQESWTTGNEETCYGDPGDTICVWQNVAHTAYTVRNVQPGGVGPNEYGDPYVMYSPNEQNRGGGYYCVTGTCRAQGDAYWNYNGRAGGP